MADPPTHPLRGLLIAKFFSASNDNAWKLRVALPAILHAAAGMAPGPTTNALRIMELEALPISPAPKIRHNTPHE